MTTETTFLLLGFLLGTFFGIALAYAFAEWLR